MARLAAEPQRFTFDAVVRLLTFNRRRADPAGAARFTSVAGSSYPGAEVTEVQAAAATSAPRVTVGLIGLTGPVGVLPRRYSDAVVADQRARSFSLTDFLDLISHRMIAAFAAAGAKYRPHRAADAGALTPIRQRTDPVAEVLLALTGYATPGLAERLRAGAAPLRHYAGFFSAHPRSADRLEALASDWLGRPVKVEQFAGAWMALPLDQRTRLPAGVSLGAFGQLGLDAAAGVRAWDQQARIVLRIGPLDLAYFERLLPDGPLLRELVALVRAFIGFEVGFAVNPVLARNAVPPLGMPHPGEPGAAGAGPLLGWNTWLPTSAVAPRRTDAGDALFEAEIVEGRA
ncbi:MAG: type secretion system protein ImpH [Rhodospirillaceae bacterium]|nr:type secretion system protein ImpH [Rhodospirillaceae bacterium]